jgi:hypothetical protein
MTDDQWRNHYLDRIESTSTAWMPTWGLGVAWRMHELQQVEPHEGEAS